MALRRVLAFLLLALLVADGMAFLPGARAFTTVAFNTTALFDAGTKTNVSTQTNTCENVTANAMQLNNTGSFIGVGETIGSSHCATGAWGVSSSGLVLSYDMQTLSSGKMRDFSGNGNDGALVNGPSPSLIGRFGQATGFNGVSTNQYVTTSTIPTTVSSFSLSAWIKLNASLSGIETVAGKLSYGTLTGQTEFGLFLFQISTTFFQCNIATGAITKVTGSNSNVTKVVPGVWYFFGCTWTQGGALRVFVNNTWSASTYTGSSNTTVNPFRVAMSSIAVTQPFKGLIDETLFFSRDIGPSAMLKLYTDGRSSFLSSGSWSSPLQSGQVPVQAQLSFTGQTASNHISRFRVISGGGVTVYDKTLGGFTTSPLTLDLSNITFSPATWTVKLDMIGNGSATSQITSILLTIGSPATFDTNAMIFILFLICVFGLSIAGFWLELPVLTIFGGISGFGFMAWFLSTTGFGVLTIIILGISAFFLIGGALYAIADAT